MPPDIFFVSAGLLEPKKTDHPFARRHYYLNYGALGLCTRLKNGGCDAHLWHGLFDLPTSVAQKLLLAGFENSKWPLLLSLPSYYSLPWAREFCRIIKSHVPQAKIVAGGRWVVDGNSDWIKRNIPEIDQTREGIADAYITSLASNDLASASMSSLRNTVDDVVVPFAFELAEDYARFQPSIEISRGCGMGCAFCAESAVRLTRLPKALDVERAVSMASEYYRGESIHPYFEASIFMPNAKWSNELASAFQESGLNVEWRCETRVDALLPRTLENLRRSGLKVIDLGLESASPTQLRRMNKTTDVDRYLSSANLLLRLCRDLGIWVKVNILLYAGETAQTVSETVEWLDDRRDCIKGVSVGPVVLYGTPFQIRSSIDQFQDYGAYATDPSSAERSGITKLHLSRSVTSEDAERLRLDISRMFMKATDYYDLKAFSYFDRRYTLRDFRAELAVSNPDTLPFRID